MSKLSSKERKSLPKSDFGLPKRRGYPMPDKSHARDAKARASEQERKGKLSAANKAKIDAKADHRLDGDRASGKSDHPSAHAHLSAASAAMRAATSDV